MPRETVLEEFKKFSAVPRRSYHCEKAIAYAINWAKDHGFEYIYDDKNGNVIIRKPAARGCENKPGIVLQGHLDMVPAQDEGVEHDWENQGLDLIEDGDWLKAKGTTLGADDGVALALAFSLFTDDSIKNPPMEILLTTNEEVGMESVKDADFSCLKGKYLFNLDSGPEGVFVIGCCGGHTVKARVPNKRESFKGNPYVLSISGLKGGHSGMEIHKERANAINLLGKIFNFLGKKYDYRISSLTAEGKDNAISNSLKCSFISPASKEEIEKAVEEKTAVIKKIYRLSDPDIIIKAEEGNASDALSKESSDMLSFLLLELPFGMLHREQDLSNTETSVNMGVAETAKDAVVITISVRSSVDERADEVVDEIKGLCDICGAQLELTDKSYPAWLPDYSSPLIDLFKGIYKRMYGKDALVETVHGGLECGYILRRSNLEAAIAMGPTSQGEHTTSERLSISSLYRTYDFLKEAIEAV